MAKKINRFEHNPGMTLLLTFLILFGVSYLTISVAAGLFPKQIVLGTNSITRVWALIHSVTALTLINTFALPLIHEWQNRQKRMLSDRGWIVVYLIINFVGIWCISRYAVQLGLGILSWKTALGLAVGLDFVQGMGMKMLEKWRMD